MDGDADTEMPAPKRVRLEKENPKESSITSPVIDDLDDLYGTPPACEETSEPKIAQVQKQPIKTETSSLVHLPGLSMSHEVSTQSQNASDPRLANDNLLNFDRIPAEASQAQNESQEPNFASEGPGETSVKEANGFLTSENVIAALPPSKTSTHLEDSGTEKDTHLDGQAFQTDGEMLLDEEQHLTMNREEHNIPLEGRNELPNAEELGPILSSMGDELSPNANIERDVAPPFEVSKEQAPMALGETQMNEEPQQSRDLTSNSPLMDTIKDGTNETVGINRAQTATIAKVAETEGEDSQMEGIVETTYQPHVQVSVEDDLSNSEGILSTGAWSERPILSTSGETQANGEPHHAVQEASGNAFGEIAKGDATSETTHPITTLKGNEDDTHLENIVPNPGKRASIGGAELPENVESVTSTFEQLAEANKTSADAEFELDSSPYESTSSSGTSSDTSSSDESDEASDVDDYEMLSPEEQARRLMAEDGDTEEKVTSGGPKTLNEKPDEVVPKPNVTITGDMVLEELGFVDKMVENLALIKANTSGEYQVLESGSVLCLKDRSVIGAVSETLGRVQQPYYSVRFTNAAAIKEAGVALDTTIFYVPQLSTTVFTQPLKAFKGSDASNLHDEEVGDDELEFSDDEAEAEHKRQVKLQKQARYDSKHPQKDGFTRGSQQRPGKQARHDSKHAQKDGFSRGPQQKRGKTNQHFQPRSNPLPERPPDPAELSLNYDDGAMESDDLYTPLARPPDLHMMMPPQKGPLGEQANRGATHKFGRGQGRGDQSDGRGRGRGNRGIGRGDRGNSQRGSFGNNHPSHLNNAQNQSADSRTGNPQPLNTSLPPRPPQQSNVPQPYTAQQQIPSYSTHPSPPPSSQAQYPPHYPQPYNQPYHHQISQQHPQPQYANAPYSQGISRQTFLQTQAFSPTSPLPPQQPPPPSPRTPANIPPGAHINPNFFRQQQAQNSPQVWQQQQGQPSSSPQNYQGYQQHPPGIGPAASSGPLSPEAARRLQENLNLLRGLNGGGVGGNG